jgi:hypothetical protein
MIEEKQIPLHELKYYYSERRGFVFTGNARSSSDALNRLAESIQNAKLSNMLPEFIVRLAPNITAFVYPEDCNFQQAIVYQVSQRFTNMGMFNVDTLCMYLRNN